MEQATTAATFLSDRVKTLPGSPIRALLSSARGQAELDLGGGIPDPEFFPNELLAELAGRILMERAASALQYAPTEGLDVLRGFVVERLRRRGCQVNPEQVLITHGSQQALSAAAALLTGPTQAVALEQPVYPGAMQAFAFAQAPVKPLPVTEGGWDLSAIRNEKLAALYVIPSFQNPTGRTANLEQRRNLAEYAERTGTFVVEDDAYGELDFAGNIQRPVLADAPTRGILLGTFSKTLCPGLRVGWIVAPPTVIDPLVRILQASSLQPGTFAQHLASSFLAQVDWEAHLQKLRREYSARATALHARCREVGLRAFLPQGGFFLWAELSGNASSYAQRAAAQSVLMVPERAFRHPSYPGFDCHLRLAFSRFLDLPRDRAKLRDLAKLDDLARDPTVL